MASVIVMVVVVVDSVSVFAIIAFVVVIVDGCVSNHFDVFFMFLLLLPYFLCVLL